MPKSREVIVLPRTDGTSRPELAAGSPGEGTSVDNRIVAATQKAAEWYSERTVLRAMIQVIPYAGGPLDALFGGWGAKLIARRQAQLLEELRAAFQRIEEEKVDKAFIESEGFLNLVLRGLDHSARTHRVDRIRLLARIIAGAATAGWGEDRLDDSEALLDLAASLSASEVVVLSKIIHVYNNRPRLPAEGDQHPSVLREFFEAGGKELMDALPEEVLLRLAAKGLLKEQVGRYWGGADIYFPTELAFLLLDLLSAVPVSDERPSPDGLRSKPEASL